MPPGGNARGMSARSASVGAAPTSSTAAVTATTAAASVAAAVHASATAVHTSASTPAAAGGSPAVPPGGNARGMSARSASVGAAPTSSTATVTATTATTAAASVAAAVHASPSACAVAAGSLAAAPITPAAPAAVANAALTVINCQVAAIHEAARSTPVATPADQPPAIVASAHARVAAGIQTGVTAAFVEVAGRDHEFDLPSNAPAWAKAHKASKNEAHWMSREIATRMQGIGLRSMPAGPYHKRFTIPLMRSLPQRRAAAAGAPGLRAIPRRGDYIVNGRHLHVVNFCTTECQRELQEVGLMCVPCDNPSCNGQGDGSWDTEPLQWSCETSSPAVNLGKTGLPSPVICMRSKCNTCGAAFHHIGAVTLARLRDVPRLRNHLPFDPEWRFGDVSLGVVHTNSMETDMVTRQGMKTLLEKVERLGAKHAYNAVEEYVADAQLWFTQMDSLVSDAAWAALRLEQQVEHAQLRGEWLVYSRLEDRIAPLGRGGGLTSKELFGFPSLTASSFTASILEVFERRRLLRERQQCSVGCAYVCSIDFCASSGERLGGKWQMLACNEENNLIGSLVVPSTNLKGVIPFLRQLKSRPNFKAKVVIIDNVPPSIKLDALSELESMLMTELDIEWVGQDRFHVAHSFSPKFNNTHAQFWEIIILGWRHATVARNRDCERLVDEKLMAAAISKSCTFRDVKYEICGSEWRKGGEGEEWQSVEEETIAEWKASGLYHELFSTSPNVVVPEDVLQREALVASVDRFIDYALGQMFDSSNGTYTLKRINGRALAQNDYHSVRKVFENAKARIVKCCPPPHLRAWGMTGECDHNELPIWKPYFHSCGVENWNSQQVSFVAGGNTKKEVATACFYEGNAKLITIKEVNAGRQEELRTSNPTVPLRCNAWAGHSHTADDLPAPKRHKLLRDAPFFVQLPPAPASGEVCVQPLGRFDATTRRRMAPLLTLQFEPSVQPQLSQHSRFLLSCPPPLPPATTVAAVAAAPIAAPAPPAAAPAVPVAIAAAAAAVAVAAATVAAPPSTPAPAAPAATVTAPIVAATAPLAAPPAAPAGPSTAGLSPFWPQQGWRMPSLPPRAPQGKRPYQSKRQRVATRHHKQNPWLCICGVDSSHGRTYHAADCPIERWLTDESYPAAPILGTTLTKKDGSKFIYKQWTSQKNRWEPA